MENKKINSIINAYDYLVKGIEKTAKVGVDGRAYGGIIRAGKGKMVESIATEIIKLAWEELEQRLAYYMPCIVVIDIISFGFQQSS